jgi:hypothetical protein
MWSTIRGIHSGAIAVAFFGCYILPTVVAWLIFETARALFPSLIQIWAVFMGFLMLWALFLAPVCAGYLVARLSKVAPLFHGLLVSGVGSILYVMYLSFAGNKASFLPLLVVPVVLSAGLFGAWLWRYRSKGAIEL